MYLKIFLIALSFIVGNLFSNSYPEASSSIVETTGDATSFVTSTISDVVRGSIQVVDNNTTEKE